MFGDLSSPLFDEKDFVEAFGITDWKDKWEVQNGRISAGDHDPGLPTLRDSEHVVLQQKSYLKALKELGVRGFRIDAAKHMTLEHLAKVWVPEITQGMHIFGEIITDGGATKEEYELFLQPYLEQTRLAAYDFPLFSTIFNAFSKTGSLEYLVDPFSLGQALSNPRAITFTTTHDIPNNDVFVEHVMDEDMEWLALAYVIGRDGGVPLIYADLDTSGITNKAGEPRWQDMWCHPKMAHLLQFHNAVHGEPMTIVESSKDHLVIGRGSKGTVIINKGKKKSSFTLNRPSGTELVTSVSIIEDANKIDVVVASASFALILH
ncbi:Alpha-amylase (fragment) [Vibrio tapetis subsp. tapetis]|uniref:Alpha-amylase n=1 Tax=Vibrio tapetis subsp. tapetis TaxID=1671868 RepID=A0A2N8ZKF2_9VIBR